MLHIDPVRTDAALKIGGKVVAGSARNRSVCRRSSRCPTLVAASVRPGIIVVGATAALVHDTTAKNVRLVVLFRDAPAFDLSERLLLLAQSDFDAGVMSRMFQPKFKEEQHA